MIQWSSTVQLKFMYNILLSYTLITFSGNQKHHILNKLYAINRQRANHVTQSNTYSIIHRLSGNTIWSAHQYAVSSGGLNLLTHLSLNGEDLNVPNHINHFKWLIYNVGFFANTVKSFFIYWTFNFMYFVGMHDFEIPTKYLFTLVILKITWNPWDKMSTNMSLVVNHWNEVPTK